MTLEIPNLHHDARNLETRFLLTVQSVDGAYETGCLHGDRVDSKPQHGHGRRPQGSKR